MPEADARPRAIEAGEATGSVELRSAAAGASAAGPDADRALVDACLRGDDPTAFTRLVERHQAYVFRLALSVLGPGGEGDAQDVAQDVFVKVARHLKDFRGESTLQTWLRRLTVNLGLDCRRRARWRKPHVDAAVLDQRPTIERTDDPLSSAEAAERRRAVACCLDALPDAVRSVIHLHYWLECSVDEIAEMLRIPEGTVKSHLHRGRKLLFRAMQAEGLDHD